MPADDDRRRRRNSLNPPDPRPDNLFDAITPGALEDGLSPFDFTRRYEGCLSVDEIKQLGDLSWLTVSRVADLKSFRDGASRGRKKKMPPTIVVTAPQNGVCHTQICDGRGRVNFAKAYALRLQVWHMVHKHCL